MKTTKMKTTKMKTTKMIALEIALETIGSIVFIGFMTVAIIHFIENIIRRLPPLMMLRDGKLVEYATPQGWSSWIYYFMSMIESCDDTMSKDYSFFRFYLFRYIFVIMMFSGPVYLLCYPIYQLCKAALQKLWKGGKGEENLIFKPYL